MKKTKLFIAVVASVLCLMIGCIGVAFAESDPAYQGQQNETEQINWYGRNLCAQCKPSAQPQNFTPNYGRADPIAEGTAVSFVVYVSNGESCTCSTFSADVDEQGRLLGESPYSLDITTTGPTQGKMTFSFAMPSFDEGKTLLLKVEKKEAPVTPTIALSGTYGVVIATQDGKQLSDGGQFVADKPITLEWVALYSDYEIESMTNTSSKSGNTAVRIEGTDTWVIENPITSEIINIRCTEVRKDGKIQVQKATVSSQEHVLTLDGEGNETPFFAPGDTVYVKLVDMDGLKKKSSDHDWQCGGKEGQRKGTLAFDSEKQLYYFVVPSDISRSTDVVLCLEFESSDTENYLFSIGGSWTNASAQVLVDGVPSKGIARTVLDAGEQNISVEVTVEDGSKYAIAGTISAKDASGPGPHPGPISLTFGEKGTDKYSANATISSNYVRDGFIVISLTFARTDDRHSLGYFDGNTEVADFNCYVVESSDPGRVTTDPVTYVLAGEKVRFVLDVPEGKFASSFKPVCKYPTENYPKLATLSCTKIDSDTYEVSYTGEGTDVKGSSLVLYSKLAPYTVNLDTEGSKVDASNGKEALAADLQGVLTMLQNGKTPTGMSAEDAAALMQLTGNGLDSASIGFSAEDASLTEEEVALVKSALGDGVVTGTGSFDLSANVQLIVAGSTGENGSQDQENAQLNESNENQGNESNRGTAQIGEANLTALDVAVALTVPVDASIASENTAMYRIHEGAVEKVEGATVADGKVSFGADRFSTYFIVDASTIAGADPTPGGTGGSTQSSVAQTGDSAFAIVFGAVALLAVAAGAAVVARRRSSEL